MVQSDKQASKTVKRPTIWELREQAKKRHPKYEKDSWWLDRYSEMASWIIGIEKDFSWCMEAYHLDVVWLIVSREAHVTRSPGKSQAILDWKEDRHANDRSAPPRSSNGAS